MRAIVTEEGGTIVGGGGSGDGGDSGLHALTALLLARDAAAAAAAAEAVYWVARGGAAAAAALAARPTVLSALVAALATHRAASHDNGAVTSGARPSSEQHPSSSFPSSSSRPFANASIDAANRGADREDGGEEEDDGGVGAMHAGAAVYVLRVLQLLTATMEPPARRTLATDSTLLHALACALQQPAFTPEGARSAANVVRSQPPRPSLGDTQPSPSCSFVVDFWVQPRTWLSSLRPSGTHAHRSMIRGLVL